MSDESCKRDSVLNLIKDAWRAGRTIVPLFGAGCSYDAGMPVVTGIQRFLYKFRAYLDKDVLLGNNGAKTRQELDNDKATPFRQCVLRALDRYKQTPSKFLQIFGWPGRFDVHAEIAATLQNGQLVEGRIEEAKKHVLKKSRYHNQADALRKILESAKSKDDVNWYLEDWRDTIAHFTDHDPDLADALINRLHVDRPPALAHQYAAFLTRLNFWTLLLTYNFDQYFESALRQQDIPHRVFALEEGVQFPGELLTRDTTAILKLHGDTHHLLLDHRLDEPLTPGYLERLHHCLKGRGSERPLLLVLGCSGIDRRVQSVVNHFVQSYESDAVAWVHFETDPPDCLKVGDHIHPSIHTCRGNNPGYFLKALYGRLVDRYPSSRVPYLTHTERPYRFDSVEDKERSTRLKEIKDEPFAVISAFAPGDPLNPEHFSATATASQHLAEFVREHSGIHYVIWVDLEACYSLADVVVMILDQAKRYDTGTTPIAMSQDPDKDRQGNFCYLDLERKSLPDDVIKRTVQRVLRLLRRGHFLLALDGLETLTWPPTAHHGEVQKTCDYLATHLKDVVEFLRQLAAQRETFYGSRVVVSIDPPQARHASHPVFCSALEDFYKHLRDELGNAWKKIAFEQSETVNNLLSQMDLFDEVGLNHEQVAFRLSCFRRTRCHVELKQAFEGSAEALEEVINKYCEAGYLFRVEGDGYWMNRSVRNAVYSHFTSCTSRLCLDSLKKNCPSGQSAQWKPEHKKEFADAVRETFRSFTEHDCIASTYFETYLASKDAMSFFEYVYHRVSAIRYLSKTCELIELSPLDGLAALIADRWEARINHTYGNDIDKKSWKEWFERKEWLESEGSSFLTHLRKVLASRHKFLLDVWRQAADSLRYQVPAGQIIFWVRWLLGDDFDRMFAKNQPSDTESILRRFLLELWGESAFERMHFEAAATVFKQLENQAENSAQKEQATLAQQRAEAYLSAFSTKPSEAWRCIDINAFASAGNKLPVENKLPLDAHLWKLSAALAELETSTDSAMVISTVIHDLDFANASARFFDYAGQANIDNSDLRISNMWLQIQHARIEALQTLDGDSANWNTIYDKIDRARALAGDSAAHRAVPVELFAGVIIRQHIERLVFRTNCPENKDFVAVKIRSFRSTLDRARTHLRRGRRNTRWLRLYFRLEIRWALWDLIMLRWQIKASKGLPSAAKSKKKRPGTITPMFALAKLQETVRVALAAIRSRLDLDLDNYANDYTQFREQFPSLNKWWLALRDLAVLTSQDIATVFGSANSNDSKFVEEKSMELFHWLSTLAGLPLPEDRSGSSEPPPSEPPPNLSATLSLAKTDDALCTIIAPLLVQRHRDESHWYYSLVDPG